MDLGRIKRIAKSCTIGAVLAMAVFPGISFSQPTVRDLNAADRAADIAEGDIRKKTAARMEAAPEPLPRPAEEEKPVPTGPTIYVSKIELIGTESFPPEELHPILEDYEKREVTREELDTAARDIQKEYLKRGIISACFIPPQEIKEGVVVLRVVEAKMGELEVSDHPFFDKGMTRNYWTSRPGKVLRYDTMSRNLQIMNMNPDREVRATLHAGTKPETTDVLLDVNSQFPVHFTGSYDTEGARETGRVRKGIGIRDNNFLFVDDIFIGGYSYGTYFSNVYFFHRVPVTDFGTNVMYGYSYSKSAPKKDQEPLGMISLSRNTSVFVYQDLFRGDEYMGDAHVGMEWKDKTVKWISGTLNRDRFTVFKAGSKLIASAWGGVTYLTPEISQGLNAFGARGQNPLSSRNPAANEGVSNTFTKFNMGVLHKRPLPFDTQASINFQSQISSEKLASQEEFFVGGIDSVRGYPAGDFFADDVFQVNLEFLFPVFFLPEWLKAPYGEHPLRDDITGLLFSDYAHAERKGVWDAQVAGGEKRIVDDASVGAGVRIRIANQALLRLEWGYPTGGNRAISETASSRLHFSIEFEERLPREIERIRMEAAARDTGKRAWRLLDEEMQVPGSPLNAMLQDYYRKAQEEEDGGDIAAARGHYQKIYDAIFSVYDQTANYILGLEEKEKALKSDKEAALAYARHGDTEKARELWEKILRESQIGPLKLVL